MCSLPVVGPSGRHGRHTAVHSTGSPGKLPAVHSGRGEQRRYCGQGRWNISKLALVTLITDRKSHNQVSDGRWILTGYRVYTTNIHIRGFSRGCVRSGVCSIASQSQSSIWLLSWPLVVKITFSYEIKLISNKTQLINKFTIISSCSPLVFDNWSLRLSRQRSLDALSRLHTAACRTQWTV